MGLKKIVLEQAEAADPKGAPLLSGNLDLIGNLQVQLAVCVGTANVSVSELFSLREGASLTLKEEVSEPVRIFLDGKPIAAGELIAVDDHFGVRITAILGQEQA